MLPTITIQTPSYISLTTATGNGNITDAGGENCTRRGFVFSLYVHGDPGNVAPADSDYENYTEDIGIYIEGAFTKNLSALVRYTTYYIRSYAYNSAGYSYSDEISFTTLSDITPTTWGVLPKNQTDPEKIEEAIARLIDEHNEDEEAHLGVGQSLQSHKASEIIDHIAASVIADKIKDGEVTVPKLGWDRFFVMPELESVDAWNKTQEGTGAAITPLTIGTVYTKCGNASGNKTILFVENPFVAVGEEKNPCLSVRLDDDGESNQDIGMAIGYSDPFSVSQKMIGIKYIKADNKIYAFYIYYSGGSYHEVKHEIAFAPPAGEIYKIVVDSVNELIYYYINNVLKETTDYSANPPAIDSNDLFCIGCCNASAGDNFNLYITNPVYYQNWS